MKRVLALALVVPLLLVAPATEAQRVATLPPPGTVVSAQPLVQANWIPQTTRKAFLLKYVSTNARGERAFSTGRVFITRGTPPAGGWRQ